MAQVDENTEGHEGATDESSAEADNLTSLIRRRVREARNQKGLNQGQLGLAIGASRFTINRIEKGSLELTPTLARALDLALGINELFALTEQRERLSSPTIAGRDATVSRILSTPGLRRIRVVMNDDADIHRCFFDAADGSIDGAEVEIVIPSIKREEQLFGNKLLFGHVEYQLKRLLDMHAAENPKLDHLTIYESDETIAGCVIGATRTGTECALWSPISTLIGTNGSSSIPVGTSFDPQVTAHADSYFDGLISNLTPLKTNEALCRLTAQEPTSSESDLVATRFSGFFSVGVDDEHDVDFEEGFAVALILVTTVCAKGKSGVGRRIVGYKRPSARDDNRRLSLFSNRVDYTAISCVRDANGSVPIDGGSRSKRTGQAAALDIDGYLRERSYVIPDEAFVITAQRELRMFGLAIEPTRFEHLPLPRELQMVRKPGYGESRRAAVSPRLFRVEIGADDSSNELSTLERNGEIELLGAADLTEAGNLNDFLLAAREAGTLGNILKQLDVTDR